jgi:hypothetical protein
MGVYRKRIKDNSEKTIKPADRKMSDRKMSDRKINTLIVYFPV